MRATLLAAVAAAALVSPATAGAHSRGRTVALDYRLKLIGSRETAPGVQAEVIDGNREMRFTVDPRRRVIVPGLLGEPMLRFSRSGVWVYRRSPTAAADRLVPPAASGAPWTRLSRGHSYRWHDHRLTPPAGLQPGARRVWSLPITIDGRPAAIRGWYERVTQPRWWAWLAAIIVAGGMLQFVVQRVPNRRGQAAAVMATLSAVAAIVSGVAFAAPDVIDPLGAWIQVGATAALAVIGAAAFFVRTYSIQRWAAALVGIGVFCIGLSALGVFWHGVVISSLPAGGVRLSTAVAVVGGASAAMLGAVADDQIGSETASRRRASRGFARYVAGEELLAVQERRRRRR